MHLGVRRAEANKKSSFFSGYYKNQSATDEIWNHGWLQTGDIVREGDDRSLFFVDRKKNIIRRSGENISIAEVEGVLSEISCVKQCAVAPVSDSLRGEEVFACIVLRNKVSPSRVTAQSIMKFCLQYLSYFKCPARAKKVSAEHFCLKCLPDLQ